MAAVNSDQAHTLEYIASHLRQLHVMAVAIRNAELAYLIEMALMAAEEAVNHQAKTGQ